MRVVKFKRGQIWWYKAQNSFDGSVQGKTRPVIIMSNDLANIHSNCLLVVPCTTVEKKELATHVTFEIDGTVSTALAENIMSINADRLTNYIGMVDYDLLNKLEYCCAVALELIKFYKPRNTNTDNIKENQEVEVSQEVTTESSNLTLSDITIIRKPGRKPKYDLDDMIRFVKDYENHDKDYMLRKYELKDVKALQQKAYLFRKQIKENA